MFSVYNAEVSKCYVIVHWCYYLFIITIITIVVTIVQYFANINYRSGC
jgi:hypothetical protein